MSVKITDCTIRDGGYLLNKNSNPTFVTAILQGLSEAGIDFVETGFLQDVVTSDSLVYGNSKDARKYLPVDKKQTEFLGFCDNSRFSPDNLDEYDGESFKWLRISFAKHELDSAIDFCNISQKKGYIVQFNPMDVISYSDSERNDLINKVNKAKPGSLSIVDTFGAMYLNDLIHIFDQFDSLLDKKINIGLHSHDNLGLSNALAETMIMLSEKSNRDIIVDGSLLGMGRGAGNASTEIIADYINKFYGGSYNIPVLLELIDEYIVPLKEKVNWGYNLPMFVCGINHAHVDNVYHLMECYNSSAKEMNYILSSMVPEQRTRYGKNYSKTDFSKLDATYNKLINKGD